MKNRLFLLFISLVLLNCKQEKLPTNEEYELAVFYEIFPALIDLIYVDIKLSPFPPPPPPKGIDTNDNKIIYDSIALMKAKERWKKNRDSILKDTASIVLLIGDSIKGIEQEDLYALVTHFKNEKIQINPQYFNFSKGIKIDLEKLHTINKKLKFKYQSGFPEGEEFWKNDYGYYLDGAYSFNRIVFDKTKSFGVFNTSYFQAPLNGSGLRIFIKKNKDGKWIIDKAKQTWVS